MFEISKEFWVASTRVDKSFDHQGSPYKGSIDRSNLGRDEYFSADKCLKSENSTTYTRRKLITGTLPESKEGLLEESFVAAVYTFEGRQYIYAKGRTKDIPLEWIKSVGMLIGNIVWNLLINCIGILVLKLLVVCGVRFESEFAKAINRMWDSGTPWKSLIALVIQIVINLLSIISLGLFSTELNRVSGYVEMKTLGDERSELTRGKRFYNKSYFARCQQPFFKILEGKKIDLTLKDESMNIIPMISPDQRRDAVGGFLVFDKFKAVPIEYTNFKND